MKSAVDRDALHLTRDISDKWTPYVIDTQGHNFM
jgi:hypothetical protein